MTVLALLLLHVNFLLTLKHICITGEKKENLPLQNMEAHKLIFIFLLNNSKLSYSRGAVRRGVSLYQASS